MVSPSALTRRFVLALVVLLLLGACGTRVEESQFDALLGIGDERGGELAGGDGDGGGAGGGADADPGSSSGLEDLAGGSGDGSGAVAGGSGDGAGGGQDGDGTGGSQDGGTAGGGEDGTTAGGGQDGPTGGNPDGTTGGGGEDGTTGGGQSQPNEASDVGVTEDSIKVGNIVSLSGPLGANAFGGMYFGANAHFQLVNARGGVHGRTIDFVRCDDAEDPSRNQECVQRLVEDEQVFALVANSTRAYSGAEFVSDNGVPDIHGQPIGNAYWTYPGFYAIRGSEYPQEGQIGYKGKLYGATLQFRYFSQEVGIETAGVVYYSVPASRQFGQHVADGLREEGLEVTEYEVNPGLPSFDSVVADMKERGIEGVWDTIDVNGNRNLCKAMDRNDFQVTAKVGTSQAMGRGIGQYSHPCRLSVYAVTESLPYSSPHEEAQLFRDVMQRLYGDRFQDDLSQWAWEGWLAAKSFVEAVETMGPAPTRDGLMRFYEEVEGYTMGGLFSPLEWTPLDFDSFDTKRECLIMSKWNEDMFDFERVSDNPFCADVPYLPYDPA